MFMIEIKPGTSSYGIKPGWHDTYRTREVAEEAVARAERRDGWSARVIEVSIDVAEAWGAIGCHHDPVATREEAIMSIGRYYDGINWRCPWCADIENSWVERAAIEARVGLVE